MEVFQHNQAQSIFEKNLAARPCPEDDKICHMAFLLKRLGCIGSPCLLLSSMQCTWYQMVFLGFKCTVLSSESKQCGQNDFLFLPFFGFNDVFSSLSSVRLAKHPNKFCSASSSSSSFCKYCLCSFQLDQHCHPLANTGNETTAFHHQPLSQQLCICLLQSHCHQLHRLSSPCLFNH